MKNTKEKVIRYLLSLEREFKNNSLYVDISRKKFNASKISKMGETELMNQLILLDTEGLIKLKFRTGYRNLEYSIPTILSNDIIHYFDKKRNQKMHKCIEVIKWLIPTIISLLALIISILSYINTLGLQ